VIDLKPYSLFTEFSDADCDALCELLEESTVWEGRAIFREGEEADGLILVESGTVRLESKRGVKLGVLQAGCAFGGVSLLVLGKRECTVLAETECRIHLLPRTSYRRLVDDAPFTACRLVESVINEFAEAVRGDLDRVVAAMAV
jgi:SulP family sulfate permease